MTPDDSILDAVRRVQLVAFDFDGVFTDNRVLVLEDGTEGVLCSRADGFGLARLRALGIQLLVLSTEVNPVVGARCRKLKLECVQGCERKAEELQRRIRMRGLDPSQVAYVGNDINDLDCLRMVGLPVCVADAYPEVKAACLRITAAKGGQGAVREFCEWLADLRRT